MKKIIALACALVMFIVSTSLAADMTVSDEIEIGREAFEEIRKQLPLIDDPDTVEYMRVLGERLSAARLDERYTYRFYVADDDTVNAFALPGGWIVFFRGLITSMENEGELVGVMAHEMSHVYFRHIAARIKKSTVVNAATVAGMVAGMLLAAVGGSPELGQALTLGSAAGGAHAQLAFSREDEMQADFGAYKLLSSAGYPPEDMEKTFRRMWRTERTMASSAPTYMLTHPTSPQRMEAIENLVRRHPTKNAKYDNNDFLRVRTRLIALYDTPSNAQSKLTAQRQADPKSAYPVYGQALLDIRLSNYKDALEKLDTLKGRMKEGFYVDRAQGICYLNLGDYDKAVGLLDKVLSEKPGDQEARLALGQAYLRQNKLEEAVLVFTRLLEDHPRETQARYDLGVAMGRLGRTAEASFHLGIAFKEGGKISSARYHLEKAVKGLADKPDLQAKAQKALDDMDPVKQMEKKKKKKEEGKD